MNNQIVYLSHLKKVLKLLIELSSYKHAPNTFENSQRINQERFWQKIFFVGSFNKFSVYVSLYQIAGK